MRIKVYVGSLVYLLLAKHLPKSYSRPFGKASRLLRNLCAQMMLETCGKNIDIEKGAVFSRRCTIGNNSGIGIDCKLNGKVIGNLEKPRSFATR